MEGISLFESILKVFDCFTQYQFPRSCRYPFPANWLLGPREAAKLVVCRSKQQHAVNTHWMVYGKDIYMDTFPCNRCSLCQSHECIHICTTVHSHVESNIAGPFLKKVCHSPNKDRSWLVLYSMYICIHYWTEFFLRAGKWSTRALTSSKVCERHTFTQVSLSTFASDISQL